MSFLHFNLLVAGLSCVSLPILIHILLRRRRQPVMWGAMRFLLEAYQQQRRRIQLEQLLILACRCLIIALIGFAVARPFFPSNSPLLSRNACTLYVVLDDTLTSAAMDAGGVSDFSRLQASAAELMKNFDASRGDRAALITLAAPAENRVSPPSSDPASVLRIIASHTPTAAAADWNRALTLVSEAIASQRTVKDTSTPVIALLTASRAGTIDAKLSLAKLPVLPADAVVLLTPPAEGPLANTAIIDVSPLRPVLTAGTASAQEPLSIGQVRVALRRSGTLAAGASKVRLEVEAGPGSAARNGAEQAVVWSQGQTEQSIVMNGPRLAAGDALRYPMLKASIDRDAIEADNLFRAPLVARDVLRVGMVAARADSKLLSGGAIGSVDQFSQGDWIWIGLDPAAPSGSLTERGGDLQRAWIDPAALNAAILSEFDILVVAAPERVDRDGWKRLRQSVDNGAVLLVFPPAATSAQTWSDAMIETLKVDLQMGREPQNFEPALPLVWNPAERPAWDPLRAIAPEAQELLKPVHVSRMLSLTTVAGRPLLDKTILAVQGNLPLFVTLVPQDDRSSRGVIYFAAAPMTPEWTDLPARPLFVPVLQELLRSGIARAALDSRQIAGRPLKVPAGAVAIRVGQSAQVIPVEPNSNVAPALSEANGLAIIDSRGAMIAALAVNADTVGSNVAVQPRDEAIAGFRGIADSGRLRFTDAPDALISESAAGGTPPQLREPPSRLSLWLFALAAVVGAVELVLGRVFSHAQPSRVKSALDMSVNAASNAMERAA